MVNRCKRHRFTEYDKIDISSRSFNRCSFSLDSISATRTNPRYQNFSFFLFFFTKSTVELFKRNGDKKKDMLHINLHRDMTIFLFSFFLSFTILFHGGFHVFKKNCLLFFAPYCVRIIRGFKEICITLHTRNISPTSVSLSLSYQFYNFPFRRQN